MKSNKRRVETGEYLSYVARTPLGSILQYGLWPNSGGASKDRRFLRYFCLVYTVGGKTNYEDEIIGKRVLTPGDLLLVHPRVTHRYGNGVGGWGEYFILFEGPLFDLWKERRLLDPRKPIVHLEPIDYWQKRLAECAEGRGGRGLAGNLQRLVDLQGLLIETIRAQGGNRSDDHGWLEQACRRLETDLAEPVDWNRLARSLGLSAETFRKNFTQTMGTTPSRYRAAKIIDRACQLSANRQMLGKQIALELGFATEQHFSRRFKEITGTTLRQFRRQWHGGAEEALPE